MARKSKPDREEEDLKLSRSYVVTNADQVLHVYDPIDAEWQSKPLSLKAVIDDLTRPTRGPGARLGPRPDKVVWLHGDIAAVVRETSTDKFEVYVIKYDLMKSRLNVSKSSPPHET